MIIIMGRAEADASRLADLRTALDQMMRATWAESGCLSYSLAIEDEGSDSRPTVITIAERWASEADLQSHFASPHMARFNAAIAGAILWADARLYTVTDERPLALA